MTNNRAKLEFGGNQPTSGPRRSGTLAGLMLTAACIYPFDPAWGQASMPPDIELSITRPALSDVTLSWPTTPGLTYDVLATPLLDQPPALLNSQPIQAHSTVTTLVDTNAAEARFYRIVQRPLPVAAASAINAGTIAEAAKVLGLELTPAQQSQAASALGARSGFLLFGRAAYDQIRTHRLQNGDPPALVFDPLPPGFALPSEQRPIVWGPPTVVARPANLADLAFYSVRDLGELIRARQVTSLELTQLSLDRLRRYDATLHCVVTLTEQLAFVQAARADAEIAAGQYRGPLHGIPYGLKDLFATKGYPTTWGAAPFRDQIIPRDAAVAAKLEAAGAVLVAKLATGELANGDRWFGGQTRNPWNPSQGSEGSSAGPAAATAAGLVPFAIGSETLGSILGPCTICRVSGLRPTFGRVSRTGAMALSWSMDKVGPIARTVEDCALVFDAIRGADGVDASVREAPFNYSAERDLGGLRVGYPRGRLNATTLARLRSIVGGTNVVEVQLPDYPNDGMGIILFAEAAAAFDELTRFGGDAFLMQSGDPPWPSTFRAARFIPAVEYLQADRLRRKLIADTASLMERVDLYVTTLQDGPSLYQSNYTGQPAVVIPLGGSSSLILVGRWFDEATLLELARAFQAQTSFHAGRPPGFVD